MAAVVLIAVLGIFWYFRTARNRPEPASVMTVLPLTTFEGYKDFGSFSPDGKSIVFSWNGGQEKSFHQNIYIKKIEGGAPVQAYFRAAGRDAPGLVARRQLHCILPNDQRPNTLSAVRHLHRSRGWGEPRKIAEGGEGVSWSPDGKVLALTVLPSDSGGIFLAALATGERTQVTRPSQYTDEYPVFSPDGQWIAFSRSVDRSEGSFSSCGWVRQMHGNLHSTTALFMARPGQPTARRSPFRQTVQAEARACGASP
jgi:Tol biopolymer transport system component